MSIQLVISIMYICIIVCLTFIRHYQKKYMQNKVSKVEVSNDFRGIDISKLQQNYDILNRLIDNIQVSDDNKNILHEIEEKKYEKKIS